MTSTDDIERDPAARNGESGAGERESGVIEVRVGVEGAATAALMTSTDDVERDPAARSGESGAGKRESGAIEVRGGVEGATTAALMTSTDDVERGPAARSRESRVGKRESRVTKGDGIEVRVAGFDISSSSLKVVRPEGRGGKGLSLVEDDNARALRTSAARYGVRYI